MTAIEVLGGWPGLAGWVTAIVGPVLVWLAARRKTDVDESAVILGKWKELVEAHETAIERLSLDFSRERERWASDVDALRARIRDLEADNRAKDAKIKQLEEETAGLKRSIIQNSKSAAQLIGGASEMPVLGANHPRENAAAIDRRLVRKDAAE